MKYYAICPVTRATSEQIALMMDVIAGLREEGHHVHFPPTDVDQNCPTGLSICEAHLKAMVECDSVLLFYDETSGGSKFDLGMAYALNKPIIPLFKFGDVPEGKSYWAMINELHKLRNPRLEQSANGFELVWGK
jgi:nucleoside 2-deoxyribosyltransferase